MQPLSFAHPHQLAFNKVHEPVSRVVFVPCPAVDLPLHKGLSWHIQFPDAVHYDMYMDIAAFVMPVVVRAHQHLMSREASGSKFHPEFLCVFRCEASFVPVLRIEADNVVMGLYFVIFPVLAGLHVQHFTFLVK